MRSLFIGFETVDSTVEWAVAGGIETVTFHVLTGSQLEEGYRGAYRDFYRWSSIWRAAASKPLVRDRLRHLAYAGGWKKLEPAWDLLIRSQHVLAALPVLETALTSFGARPAPKALRVTRSISVCGAGPRGRDHGDAPEPRLDHGGGGERG